MHSSPISTLTSDAPVPKVRLHRNELFAQGVASGKSLHQANLDAGYRNNRGARANASRLHANERIRARIAEIQAQKAQKMDVSTESIAQNLLEDRALAIRLGNPSAAVAADRALAELFGLITKKHEVRGGVAHEHQWSHEEALERLIQSGAIDVTPMPADPPQLALVDGSADREAVNGTAED